MFGMTTDKGIVRSFNEDYVSCVEKNDYNIYVVADGMGGHNAGEIASKMAIDGIIEYISENFNNEDSIEILKNAIQKVNLDIYNHAKTTDEYKGMGTTITACLDLGDRVVVANVGDSSSYLIRGNNLIKITKDHSLVQELVDLGTISAIQAAHHPRKNIITRAVGTNKSVDVDLFTLDKINKDIFMLCSDGLTNEITKEDILSSLSKELSFQQACDELVDIAKKNGGRDNITVLLFGGEV
jgi:protein phosphatase